MSLPMEPRLGIAQWQLECRPQVCQNECVSLPTSEVRGPGLIRAIGRWDLTAYVVNCMIGAGIFGIPASLYRLTGAYSVVVIILAAAIVAVIGLCFAEVGSSFRTTGGPYLYSRAAFGQVVGFEVGWLLWLARMTGYAAVVNLFVGYTSGFVPGVSEGLGRVVIVLAVVALHAVVNLVGVREAALFTNALTIGKLLPLAAFTIIGLFFIDLDRFSVAALPPIASSTSAILFAIYAFSGFELVGVAGGEIREPQSAIPFALIAGIAAVTVVYAGVQYVCVGTLPALAASTRPLADAAASFAPGASAVITLGAAISTLGASHAIMLASPRILMAMAEHGQMPSALGRVHPRFRTPYVAIAANAVIVLTLTLATTFVSALTISVLIRVLTYLATCVALPVLRRRGTAAEGAFRLPGGDAIALLGSLICLALLVSRPGTEMIQLAAAVGLGLVVLLAVSRTTRKSTRNGTHPTR
jgi:APA family basic amino acid/polyamine antiporter